MADRKLNLRSWTNAEALWLGRTARGWTQARAAKHYRVHERYYWQVENGLIDIVWSKTSDVVHPTAGVLCKLARRRHGLTLPKTAKLLGLSHVTVLARERRSDPALVKAWQAQGYRF